MNIDQLKEFLQSADTTATATTATDTPQTCNEIFQALSKDITAAVQKAVYAAHTIDMDSSNIDRLVLAILHERFSQFLVLHQCVQETLADKFIAQFNLVDEEAKLNTMLNMVEAAAESRRSQLMQDLRNIVAQAA